MATVDIPRQQKAAVKTGQGKDAKAPLKDIDVPTPGPQEVLVKINWLVWKIPPIFRVSFFIPHSSFLIPHSSFVM